MPDRYGGIYRHPPPPQRRRPSAILPSEVFPDPPVGSRARQIVMAIVAAQWIWVPQPLQRSPVVTEGVAPVVEFIPQQPPTRRVILEAWQPPPPVPQRLSPSAILPAQVFDNPPFGALDQYKWIVGLWRPLVVGGEYEGIVLPAEVFDNPPIDTRRLQTAMAVVAAWEPPPPPQPPLPRVTEGIAPVVVSVPYSRLSQDRTVLEQWVHVPEPFQRPARAILPAQVFDNPSIGAIDRLNDRIIVELWRVTPPPQQRRPAVTESGAVVEVVVAYSRLAQHRTILEQWRADPQPQQQRPRVTSDTPSVFIPRARDYDRVITDSWHVDPSPQRRLPTVTAGAPLFLAPRIDSTNNRIVVASWQHVPQPQRSRPTAILPSEVFPDPPLGAQGRQYEQVVVVSWQQTPQPQQRRPVVTESAVIEIFVPQSRVQDRLIIVSWQTVPVPQRSRPTAILLAEVFPDPPTGQQRRQVVNAFIVEQWRFIPLPYQRPPLATEGSAVAIPPIDGGVASPTLVFGGGVASPTLVFGGGVAKPTVVFGGGVAKPTLVFGGGVAKPTVVFGGGVAPPEPS